MLNASSLSESIPVVDFHAKHDDLVKAIDEACIKWGFFQVINHGVDPKVVKGIDTAMNNFFNRTPREVKEAVFRSADNPRGNCNQLLSRLFLIR